MNTLGHTGIEVSPLCFGALTMTPFQANLPVEEGANLIIKAHEQGLNFIDTAEIYDNYAYLKEALKVIPRDELVISTKSYAYDKSTASASLEKALNEIGTDYIDIFLLHEQESEHTLRGHHEALSYWHSLKSKGLIRATGISTHFIQCVKAAYDYDEIEVVHPIINMAGIGIQDGSVEEMIEAIQRLRSKGVGIYSMKALGGGHLIKRQKEAFEWIKSQDFIDAVAVGMQSEAEVQYNCDFFLNGQVNQEAADQIEHKKRRLIVADYCRACGECVKRCKQNAIELVDGRATPNENCILCGYCATVCPDFCIKVI